MAGWVGVQVLGYHTEASVARGVHLVSSGVLEVNALNKIGLQNLALAGAGSESSTAIGGAIAVNVVPHVTTEAFIDSGTITHVTQLDVRNPLTLSTKPRLVEAPAPVLPVSTLP